MRDLIGRLICSALRRLLTTQLDLFMHTSNSLPTEWNLCHHLANELMRYFPLLSIDVDLYKGSAGEYRPDIVVHKRGTHRLNFLIIEFTREKNNAHDIAKIENFWMKPPYNYTFGASIKLRWKKQIDKNGMIDPSKIAYTVSMFPRRSSSDGIMNEHNWLTDGDILKLSLLEYRKKLKGLEKKHKMTTKTFLQKFNSGKLGDDEEWFDWLYASKAFEHLKSGCKT